MKKIFIFLIMIFLYGNIFSQTERFIYQTEVNPDTINLVDPKVERTFLDIKSGRSLFVSENRLLRDSLMTIVHQQNISDEKKSKKDKPEFPKLPNGKSLQPTFFEYFIVKNNNGKEVNLVENVGPKQIYYQEDRKMDWNVSQEFSDYNGYKIQKATMIFGGRVWTAWFAPEIKVFDGPYKFSGLPGLIVKLEDDKGDYRFSFLKKISIQNSFTEEIKPDARKSTRINFQGDKAAIRIELSKNKSSDIDFNNFNPGGGRGMHQRGGGMNGGFGGSGGRTGGMPNGEMGMEGSPNMHMGNHPQNNSANTNSFTGFGNTNPIELSNK